ncbi:MAG: ABC transporter permease [bacterium]
MMAATADVVAIEAPRRRQSSLRRNAAFSAGLIIAAALVFAATLAPVIAPADPTAMDFQAPFHPPNRAHLFGTDNFGRDVLSRVLFGYRTSLLVGTGSVALALLGGVPLGLLAGYVGGALDHVIMRPMDALIAFPAILLTIALVGVLGTSTFVLMIVIAVVYLPIMVRTMRASALAVRAEPFVEGARARGASELRLALRHVLPNAIDAVLIQASILMGIAILIEAALSFLGLGTQPPNPSLGLMLADGRDIMRDAPWVVVFPGLAIMLAVLSFNLTADGLRDLLDPKAGRT